MIRESFTAADAGTRKSLANTSEEDNDAVNHESFSLFFPYS